jgi:hypothetical protein
VFTFYFAVLLVLVLPKRSPRKKEFTSFRQHLANMVVPHLGVVSNLVKSMLPAQFQNKKQQEE